ncbi:MAG: hypothetical protein M0T70_18010 [Geobacteraceae bacterium]|nr:hypothetical protein [Geobacteraceae bacterium]
MKKTLLVRLALLLLIASTLSACILLPPDEVFRDGGGRGEHHDRGGHGDRGDRR